LKLCGHTMGTPRHSLDEAMVLFSQIGFDGVEIRCIEGGHLQPETATDEELEKLRQRAEELGLEIACLTPYYGDYTAPDATEATVAGLAAVARAASRLGCRLVRAIAGRWPVEGLSFAQAQRLLAEGLRRAGDAVEPYGVTLAVETHGGTLCETAEPSLELMAMVDHPRVRLLLDYYWLYVGGDTDPGLVMPELAPLTAHVHVKDLLPEGESGFRAVPLGEGVLDWPQVLAALVAVGYEGFLSDEYEKLYREELPEPEVGMAANRRQLLAWLEEAGAPAEG